MEKLAMDDLLKRWDAYWAACYRPKKVFMKDGAFIAGEEIRRGDMVYFEG